MTIVLGWLRRRGQTVELLIAADSRLRSRGAMDQAQKLFRLERGDSCLAFCGDAQFAYPLFIQVGTTLNNHLKTRTRALDITQLGKLIGDLLNNLVGSWDLSQADKDQELATTRILLGGWSASLSRFYLGYYAYTNGQFSLSTKPMKLGHPWRESKPSLIVLGDYETEYVAELKAVLQRRHPAAAATGDKIAFNFDYEPIEALHALLKKPDPNSMRTAIGGAPQLVKVYAYCNSIPFAVRTAPDEHFLLGRRLFGWEKTEYPILDLCLDPAKLLYPKLWIPLPSALEHKEGDESRAGNEGLDSLMDD